MDIEELKVLADKVQKKIATPKEETIFYKELDLLIQKTTSLLSLYKL